MPKFNLPDLGEGLQDAEIIEWVIEEGQNVEVDQAVVVVETAKAIVELPSPEKARITKFCVNVGDTVDVGQPLFEYQGIDVTCESESSTQNEVLSTKVQPVFDESNVTDSVSVVGVLPSASDEHAINMHENFSFESHDEPAENELPKKRRTNDKLVAPPSVVAMAKKLGLESLLYDHTYGDIGQKDLLDIYKQRQNGSHTSGPEVHNDKVIKLSGARKVMAQTMTKSHQHIPSVTLFDDANIHHWEKGTDITLKLIRAIVAATKHVPLLNAWFDEENLSVQLFDDVNLGVAVNASDGLFVPVIRKVQTLTDFKTRAVLDKMIEGVNHRTIKAQRLLGATISLSNFGTLSGRYATPIIVPPQVAIVGIGTIREQPVVRDGQLVVGKIMPISLSFDHRAASGADAAAFMESLIQSLEQ